MLGDNKISFTLTRDPESQNCTKYIDVIHYHVRKLIKDGELVIKCISSSDILADSLIKAFPAGPFKRHCREWWLVE